MSFCHPAGPAPQKILPAAQPFAPTAIFSKRRVFGEVQTRSPGISLNVGTAESVAPSQGVDEDPACDAHLPTGVAGWRHSGLDGNGPRRSAARTSVRDGH